LDDPDELGVVDAAAWCGVSEDTIRRRLRDGRLPNSYRGADGAWRIPVDALRNARFGASPRLGRGGPTPTNPAVTGGHHDAPATRELVEAQARHIEDLQAEIIRLHQLLHTLVADRDNRSD
jgi:hypothetical protein